MNIRGLPSDTTALNGLVGVSLIPGSGICDGSLKESLRLPITHYAAS